MEFEKALYRVHERILSSKCIENFVKIILISAGVIFLLLIGLFIYTNAEYKDESWAIDELYEKVLSRANGTALPDDTIVRINIADFTETQENGTSFIIIDRPYLSMEVSGQFHIIGLNDDLRTKYNITTQTFYLKPENFSQNLFGRFVDYSLIGYENILINQIITKFKFEHMYIKNRFTLQFWRWEAEAAYNLDWSQNFGLAISLRVLGILKIMFGYFLLSNVTAIYIIVTIIAAPIFILMLFECCFRGNNDSQNGLRFSLYRAFPWIGLYLFALNASQRGNKAVLLGCFFLLLVLFYFIYLCSTYLWTYLLFSANYPLGLDENFYGTVAFLEFFSLVFVRTRSSLKHFPRLVFMAQLALLYYIKFSSYGFAYMAFIISITAHLIFASLILLFFEIPALEWNPSYHYAPSIDKPRVLYSPIFSMSWYYDLPQLWSIFFPLYDRSTFTQAQMSLVDRNFVAFNNAFTNASLGNQLNLQDSVLIVSDENSVAEGQAANNQNINQNNNNNQNNNSNPQAENQIIELSNNLVDDHQSPRVIPQNGQSDQNRMNDGLGGVNSQSELRRGNRNDADGLRERLLGDGDK